MVPVVLAKAGGSPAALLSYLAKCSGMDLYMEVMNQRRVDLKLTGIDVICHR